MFFFQITSRAPLKPVNIPTPKPLPVVPPLEKPSALESSQLPTSSICSTGLISMQKTLPRAQAPLAQPIRSNAQPKRTFNLLSNDSDSDDQEDNASGVLFKFDKNPVPIKRARPPNPNVAPSKSNDKTDSELFAFSSTAASQKLIASQRSTQLDKTNQRPPNQNRSDSRLCRSIISNMLTMSIQAIPITRTGWMSGKAVKKEEVTVDGEHDVFSVPKSETDEDGCESKAWIDQIKNPFEVRIRKMHLVNRSYSNVSTTSEANTTVSGKNFKAFVKVFVFLFYFRF